VPQSRALRLLRSRMMAKLPITVAIPTYRRDQVLLDTIDSMLRLDDCAAELLILDQTDDHSPQTEASLEQLNEQGHIRWLRLAEPSIPRSMNIGLATARYDLVLFVDDDVMPYPTLVKAHIEAHKVALGLVAGR